MKKLRYAINQCKYLLSKDPGNYFLKRQLEQLKAEVKVKQNISKQKKIAKIIAEYKASEAG